MKRKKIYLAIIAVIIIAGGYYWYKKTHPTSTAVTYRTSAVEKGTLTTSVSGSGNVVVDQSVNIDPTIAGTVAGLAVNVGDAVTEDQLLFMIVNNDLSVSNARAAASLQQSKNSIDSAEVQVKQARETYEAGSEDEQKDILGKQLDIAKKGLVAAQKSYAASLADYNNQLADGAKRTVKAPIAGTVNAVNIKNGDDLSNLSSSSSRVIPMVIGDLTTAKAQIQINEVDVPNIQLDQKVTMTFNAISGLTVSGKVEKMDSLGTITQGVVTYNATISFDTLDPRIKPGMSVSASIITGVKQDVLIVPNSAVKSQAGGGGNYVEVLNKGEISPRQVSVKIGAVNNTNTEIVSGLSVGDNVVTRTINPSATTSTSTSGSSSAGGVRIPGLGGGGR